MNNGKLEQEIRLIRHLIGVTSRAETLNITSRVLDIQSGRVTLPKWRTGPSGEGSGLRQHTFWSDVEASQFIESVLLGLPGGSVVLYRDEPGSDTAYVLDGWERLQAIRAFVNDELTISGAELLEGLNGARFCDLPTAMQLRFKHSGSIAEFRVTGVRGMPGGERVAHQKVLRLLTSRGR